MKNEKFRTMIGTLLHVQACTPTLFPTSREHQGRLLWVGPLRWMVRERSMRRRELCTLALHAVLPRWRLWRPLATLHYALTRGCYLRRIDPPPKTTMNHLPLHHACYEGTMVTMAKERHRIQ